MQWRMAVLLCAAFVAVAGAGRVVLLPVQVLDTSGEAQDQRAAHAARAAAVADELAGALSATGREVAVVAREEMAARCPGRAPRCLLDLVREKGGAEVLLASVHKSSSLILTLHAQLVDPAADRIVLSRELSFRGDTDEAWTHAARFLGKELAR